MAWTQEHLDALNAAIATGAREVWYGDKRVAYRDMNEMLTIKDMIIRELGLAPKKIRSYPTYKKGLDPEKG